MHYLDYIEFENVTEYLAALEEVEAYGVDYIVEYCNDENALEGGCFYLDCDQQIADATQARLARAFLCLYIRGCSDICKVDRP